MIKVGITGGIGSGKTTVCRLFELLGVPVYYSDLEARNITNHNPKVVQEITKVFGSQSYQNGIMNRPYISSIVFNDKEKLALLNSIVHPAVADHFQQWISLQQDKDYILKEAAILFESGAYESVDKVITVTAPQELRVKRVMKRDGFSADDILQRMKNQWDEEEKIKRSDEVIVADDVHLVIPQVITIHQKYKK